MPGLRGHWGSFTGRGELEKATFSRDLRLNVLVILKRQSRGSITGQGGAGDGGSTLHIWS